MGACHLKHLFVSAIALLTILISATTIWAEQLHPFPSQEIMYRLDGCEIYDSPNGAPNIAVTAINQSLRIWEAWVPSIKFFQVTEGEMILFVCHMSQSNPSGSYAEAEYAWDVGTGLMIHSTIHLPMDAFSRRYDVTGGVNVVTHELAHAISATPDPICGSKTNSEQIVQLCPETLDAIGAIYAGVPAPEFPISSIIPLFLASVVSMIIIRQNKRFKRN